MAPPVSAVLAVFEASPAPMLLVDAAAGLVVDANGSALALYGYARETLRGMPISSLNMASPDAIRSAMDRAGTGATFLFDHRLASGEIRAVEVRSGPIELEGRRLLLSVIHPRDGMEVIAVRDEAAGRTAASDMGDERYRQLVDPAFDGILVIGPDRHVRHANARAYAILGLQPGDTAKLEELQAASLVSGTGQERAEALARFAAGQEVGGDASVTRADGARIWVEQRARRRPDGSVIAVLRDVTAEREAREALAASEDRYRTLFESLHQGAMVIGPDGTFEAANAVARTVLAPGGMELRGTRVGAFVRYLRADGSEMPLGELPSAIVRETGRPSNRVTVGVDRGDGSVVWLSSSATPMDGVVDGAEGRILVSFSDVTELHSARAQLSDAHRMAHLGSWSWRASTGRVEWSDEVRAILGVEPGTPGPAAREVASYCTPDTYARLRPAIEASIAGGVPFETDIDMVRADGSVRHVLVRGEAQAGPAGRVDSLRGTVLDVTVLREAQARVDQAARAELVGQLAAGVAHDFNNLLAAVSGYAELIDASLAVRDPMRADVAGIQEATRRAAVLTRQLLAFGRRQLMRPVVLDVGDVVGGLAPLLRSMCGDRVTLRYAPPAVPCLVQVDRTGLEQCIVNLVINARDAMPDGGTATIEVCGTEVGSDLEVVRPPARPGTCIAITVRDTGTGIEPATLRRIFEPFFTTKGVGRGSGLGLSSVEGIVAQSDGMLAVETVPGEGSAFTILLPAVETDAPPQAVGPARQVSPIAGARILVVDDQPVVRLITRRMLESLDCVVADVDGPRLAAPASEGVDLVLADVLMPGETGPEMVRRLRAGRPGLRALYMTGFSPETVFAEGLLPPGAPLLAKPFTREELQVAVTAALAADQHPLRPVPVGGSSPA